MFYIFPLSIGILGKKIGVDFIINIFVYDVGNIWEMLGAIGTFLAVVLSLGLTLEERKVGFSVISFTQDRTKEIATPTGMRFDSQRVLIFYGLNNGKRTLNVLYKGIRIKRPWYAKNNEALKVKEESTNDPSFDENDFEQLVSHNKTKSRTIDFDNIHEYLLQQIPKYKKTIKIEFVYQDINGKELKDSLKFENPEYEKN